MWIMYEEANPDAQKREIARLWATGNVFAITPEIWLSSLEGTLRRGLKSERRSEYKLVAVRSKAPQPPAANSSQRPAKGAAS
jgi:hypothetical protein